MQAFLTKEDYTKIYDLLANSTPLCGDCGQLCHAACCNASTASHVEMGIYLYPGEHVMFENTQDAFSWHEQAAQDYDFPPSWHGNIHFLDCNGNCQRANRPLQCRFFPLSAHLTDDDKLQIIFETWDLPYTCPLIEDRMPILPEYIANVYAAYSMLLRDPNIKALIKHDSAERDIDDIYILFSA
ncbi:MAG: hypothetical protein WCI30_05170 [Clostridia bacterium]